MKTEHLLIIRFSAIGDVAMAVPVVKALAEQYPHLRITFLSRPFARPFFEELAPNVGFMEADIKGEYRGVKGLNKLYRRLTAKQFTAIADFHNILRSNYLRLRFNLGMFRVEHINKHRSGKRRLTSQNNKRLVQQPTTFENYADVLARLGYPVKLDERLEVLVPGLEDNHVDNSPFHVSHAPVIGVAPFAAHRGKVYPEEKMEKVLELLTARWPGSRIYLFGGGGKERGTMTEWAAKYLQCTLASTVAKGLKEELQLMSRLNVMLSMDSANMHLASLAGVPVVSVWGATHPYAGFLGWGQTADNCIQTDLDCRPCSIYGKKPCQRGDYACLNLITPKQIVDKLEIYLK